MNLNILEFGGQKVITGFLEKTRLLESAQGTKRVLATIRNRAYIDGAMRDSSYDVVFVDKGEKWKYASWILGIQQKERISAIIAEHDGVYYAMKATDKSEFVWEVKNDDGDTKTVIYGPVSLKQIDAKKRFVKVVTRIGEKEWVTTFWNNKNAPLGERIRKVFEFHPEHPTFLVTGKRENFNGSPTSRGCWFICD